MIIIPKGCAFDKNTRLDSRESSFCLCGRYLPLRVVCFRNQPRRKGIISSIGKKRLQVQAYRNLVEGEDKDSILVTKTNYVGLELYLPKWLPSRSKVAP